MTLAQLVKELARLWGDSDGQKAVFVEDGDRARTITGVRLTDDGQAVFLEVAP